jgi:hypothetical protein
MSSSEKPPKFADQVDPEFRRHSKSARTVKELREILAELPDDMRVETGLATKVYVIITRNLRTNVLHCILDDTKS